MQQGVNKEKSALNLFDLYDEGKKLSNIYKKLFNKIGGSGATIPSISNSIDDFISNYQDHVRSYTPESLQKVACAALRVEQKLNDVLLTLRIIQNSLSGTEPTQSGNTEFSEYIFGNISSAIDYSIKIKVIIELYERILNLLEIDKKQYPLEIIKFETGSPWYIKITGHPIVLTIVTNLMIVGAQYIHSSYTENSPLNTIPRAADAADKLLKITNQLEKAGFDVEGQRKSINDTISILAKDLNTLISDQAKIEINGKESKISGSSEKFIERAKKHLIENK